MRKTRSKTIYSVGTIVRKRFIDYDGKYYEGEVISYDPVRKHYTIKYTDGDQEDYDEEDMKRYYKLMQCYDDREYDRGSMGKKPARVPLAMMVNEEQSVFGATAENSSVASSQSDSNEERIGLQLPPSIAVNTPLSPCQDAAAPIPSAKTKTHVVATETQFAHRILGYTRMFTPFQDDPRGDDPHKDDPQEGNTGTSEHGSSGDGGSKDKQSLDAKSTETHLVDRILGYTPFFLLSPRAAKRRKC